MLQTAWAANTVPPRSRVILGTQAQAQPKTARYYSEMPRPNGLLRPVLRISFGHGAVTKDPNSNPVAGASILLELHYFYSCIVRLPVLCMKVIKPGWVRKE